MGGPARGRRQETRLHPRSLQPLLELLDCQPAPRHVSDFGERAQPGPLATFKNWKELGRHVKKGEKAISLRIPISGTRTKTLKKDDGTTEEEAFTFKNFLLKARWFTLHQTEGAEYQPTSLPDWNEEKAL